MTWLARRRPLLQERLQPFTNLHILGGGGWEGALNFCSSPASQRGFWILPFEKWAKFNIVSIEHCVSPLSTFTHSFSVSDGGQGASSGLRLGRTEGPPLGSTNKAVWVRQSVKATPRSLTQEGVTSLRPPVHTSSGHAWRMWGAAGRWGGKGKANRMNTRNGFKDSVSKLSQIQCLERFKYL